MEALKTKAADFKEQQFRRDCVRRGKLLTGRQMEVLRECLKDVIVEDRGRAAVGKLMTSARTISALLQCCAIKEDSFGYYVITPVGREILGAPKEEPPK
jgi:hypothetical protein